MIVKLERLHDSIFTALERAAGDWFLGLTARLVFSSVLLAYFLNSAATKLGDGLFGFLSLKISAYAQIVPPIAEASGFNASKIAFIPWGLIVHLGTYAETLIPLMILAGLFTRLASLAMIGFILVMTFVDITFHGLAAADVGLPFDRVHNAIVADQRLLWLLPLVYLVVKGGGAISADRLLKRFSRL